MKFFLYNIYHWTNLLKIYKSLSSQLHNDKEQFARCQEFDDFGSFQSTKEVVSAKEFSVNNMQDTHKEDIEEYRVQHQK